LYRSQQRGEEENKEKIVKKYTDVKKRPWGEWVVHRERGKNEKVCQEKNGKKKVDEKIRRGK